MIQAKFPARPTGPLSSFGSIRRPVRALCAAFLACWISPSSAIGLVTDSAEHPGPDDSLSHVLITSILDLPEGLVLSDQDLTLVLASMQMPASQIPPDANERVRSVLSQALAMLGTPYRWGGSTPASGFDCSGLVNYVFRTALGIELPRISREMALGGEPVERSALSAGDLVFFSRRGRTVSHVGIYLGNGHFVHAPRTGRDVTISRLNTGYWHQRFLRARRVPDLHY